MMSVLPSQRRCFFSSVVPPTRALMRLGHLVAVLLLNPHIPHHKVQVGGGAGLNVHPQLLAGVIGQPLGGLIQVVVGGVGLGYKAAAGVTPMRGPTVRFSRA